MNEMEEMEVRHLITKTRYRDRLTNIYNIYKTDGISSNIRARTGDADQC